MTTEILASTNDFVKKHSNLIVSIPDSRMSLKCRQAMNVVIKHCYPKFADPTNERLEISYPQFCEDLGVDVTNFTYVNNILLQMVEIRYNEQVIKDDYRKSRFKNNQFLIEPEIINSKVSFQVGVEFQKHLYNPEFYGKIALQEQKKFKSVHTQIMYELCERTVGDKSHFDNSGLYYVTEFISLDILYKYFNRHPDKPFKDFNRQVLKIAINELKEKTSFVVVCEFKKKRFKNEETGKTSSKTVAIRFKISVDEEDDLSIFEKMTMEEQFYHIVSKELRFYNKIIAAYSEDDIKLSLFRLHEQLKKRTDIQSNKAYFLKIIDNIDHEAVPFKKSKKKADEDGKFGQGDFIEKNSSTFDDGVTLEEVIEFYQELPKESQLKFRNKLIQYAKNKNDPVTVMAAKESFDITDSRLKDRLPNFYTEAYLEIDIKK